MGTFQRARGSVGREIRGCRCASCRIPATQQTERRTRALIRHMAARAGQNFRSLSDDRNAAGSLGDENSMLRTEAAPPRVNAGARVWLRAPVGRRRPESRLAIMLTTRHDVLLLRIPSTTLHNRTGSEPRSNRKASRASSTAVLTGSEKAFGAGCGTPARVRIASSSDAMTVPPPPTGTPASRSSATRM